MILPASSVKKIAIFRALQLGDLLCSIPAFKALRNAYPSAEITLISLPWAASLVKRFPEYFDRFLHFPGYPGLPEQAFNAKEFSSFLNSMVSEEFDLVLQMQGNGNLVNPLMELFGAKHIAGFYKAGLYIPDKGTFIEYPEDLHEINRHLALIQALEIEVPSNELEFPLYKQDYEDLKQAQLPLTDNNYVCIHPGSRDTARQWPPAYYAKIADLAAENGLTPVLTGTKDELTIIDNVASLMTATPVIAAGKTSIGAVAALIDKSFCLVSNCTGVAHIAAALKKKSIVISLNTEPKRWEPLNKDLHTTFEWIYEPDFDSIYGQAKQLFREKHLQQVLD